MAAAPTVVLFGDVSWTEAWTVDLAREWENKVRGGRGTAVAAGSNATG